eukprot:366281-Chlamydomonas_euryale.AAC.7
MASPNEATRVHARDCLHSALLHGAVSAAKATAVSGGLYMAAMHFSPFFRYRFNASARTALVVMPIFYTTWLNVELSMHKCEGRKEGGEGSRRNVGTHCMHVLRSSHAS